MDRHFIGAMLGIPVMVLGLLVIPAMQHGPKKLAMLGIQLALFGTQLFLIFG
jgi:hypothetical protein